MLIANTPLAIQTNPPQLGLELGTGAVIGGVIGFAAKKLAKGIAVIIGVEFALFKLLESRGILDVNWSKIGATFLEAGEIAVSGQSPSWVSSVLSTISIEVGFTGFFWSPSVGAIISKFSQIILSLLFGALQIWTKITVVAVQHAYPELTSPNTTPRIGAHALQIWKTEVKNYHRPGTPPDGSGFSGTPTAAIDPANEDTGRVVSRRDLRVTDVTATGFNVETSSVGAGRPDDDVPRPVVFYTAWPRTNSED